MNSKIIEYFISLFLRLKEKKEKEKVKKLISGKEKNELIINNMKSNFPYYYKYISKNKVNLNNILLSLFKHNSKFNKIAHKNLIKNIFLKANSEIISNTLNFYLIAQNYLINIFLWKMKKMKKLKLAIRI